MKRLVLITAALALLASCAPKPVQKVMARFVPERADDFAWENDFVAYRAYGQALETLKPGGMISPGFDVWVKNTTDLVVNQRYKDDLENGISYHKDHGNGKDCYKVGVTLGGGASSPLIGGKLCFPATNFRSSEVLESSPEKVVFVLSYPQWEAEGYKISLEKKITVCAGSHFCYAEDTYSFEGPCDSLVIAAGIVRHDVVCESAVEDGFAIWEKASDTGAEPEDSCIGLAVKLPGASFVGLSEDGTHSICTKAVKSGESLGYYFGSCWSKADIPNAEGWFDALADL